MKLLLDTNVLIDYVAARSPHNEAVKKLCVASAFGDVRLWVSVQSYADAYYVLRKKASEQEVKRALLASLEVFIPCNMYASDLRNALMSEWSDLEDYLLAHSIGHIDAEYFITRDEEVLGDPSIPSMTAASLLNMLETENGLAYDELQ